MILKKSLIVLGLCFCFSLSAFANFGGGVQVEGDFDGDVTGVDRTSLPKDVGRNDIPDDSFDLDPFRGGPKPGHNPPPEPSPGAGYPPYDPENIPGGVGEGEFYTGPSFPVDPGDDDGIDPYPDPRGLPPILIPETPEPSEDSIYQYLNNDEIRPGIDDAAGGTDVGGGSSEPEPTGVKNVAPPPLIPGLTLPDPPMIKGHNPNPNPKSITHFFDNNAIRPGIDDPNSFSQPTNQASGSGNVPYLAEPN